MATAKAARRRPTTFLLFLLLALGGNAPAMMMKRLAVIPTGAETRPVCGGPYQGRDPDVTFATGLPRQWQVWQSSGWGRFHLAYADTAYLGLGVITGESHPYALGDFDRDGRADIVCRNWDFVDSIGTSWNIVAVIEAPSPESFPSRLVWYDRLNFQQAEFGRFYYPGDLDGDGMQEIVAVSHREGERYGTVIYECRGDDSAAFVWDSAALGGSTFAFGDFDLDGRQEIVSACEDVRTVECIGDDQYWVPPWRDQTPYTNGYTVFSGRDVDRNGKPEFYVAFAQYRGMYWMSYLYGWEATGDNEYQRFMVDSTQGIGTNGECADLDGDGVEELIWATGNYVRVYKAARPREYRWAYNGYMTGDIKASTGDLNRDGYNELVLGADRIDILEVEAIRVLSPNRNLALHPGDTCRVSWQTFEPPRCDSVSLFLRRDSTYRLDTIAHSLAPADTPYLWVVPDIRAESAHIMAIAYGPGWQYDESDSAIRILGNPGVEERPLVVYHTGLRVWPNPAKGNVHVEYELAQAGQVELSVLDAAGRVVAVIASGERKPGRYSVSLPPRSLKPDARPLSSGIYFLRLESGKERRVVKVVLE